ncbi:hypothetical protein [Caballeronia sordidicola]|uniref:hypothetical protein n=1 Tax=Caballeronia sordidicola TaxID=196367 RepID=UPI00117FC84B|nr:hypothetical protein [Caballeronia sordidicola]
MTTRRSEANARTLNQLRNTQKTAKKEHKKMPTPLEASGTLGKELVTLVELTAGLRTRINMIATTPGEQRKKDQDLLTWARNIDDAVTKAIRAYNE